MEHMNNEGPARSGFDLVGAAWSRRKWLAVIVFLLICVSMGSLVMFLPNLYQASATVLIEGQQVPESFVRTAVTGELETRLQTISQKILSRSRLKELITRFDLYSRLRARGSVEIAVDQMRKDIKIDLKEVEQSGGRGTPVAFTISYRGRDPKTVTDVTNVLALFYVEENLKQREGQATGMAEFLWSQLEEVRHRLLLMDQGVSPSSPSLSGFGPAEGPLDTLTARIDKLSHELSTLRSSFSDKYPDVVRLESELATLKRWRAQGVVSSPRRPVVEETPAQTPAGLKTARDYKTTKELYDSLQKRYEEARLSESMEQRPNREEFRILDSATVPERSVAPNRMRLLLFGLMLSLGAAAGVVVLVEHLDTSFHTVHELRALVTVPVLVTIPRIASSIDQRARYWRFSGAAVSVVVVLVLLTGGFYYIASGNEQLVWMLTPGRF